MFKSILLFLLILLAASAIGVGIFHLVQPSGQIAFRSGGLNIGNAAGDFGGERGFRGGFNLVGGLFGITGNLILVAVVTFMVVSLRNIFAARPEPAATR